MEINYNNYTDVHRSFVQACANIGCIDIEDALTIFQSCWSKGHQSTASEENLRNTIDEINERICFFDQKIVICTYEMDNKEYLIFANTDAFADKFQVVYNEPEVEFFRLFLKEMAIENDHSIRPIMSLNLVDQIKSAKKLTKKRAQELLEGWTAEGYFEEIDDNLYFGPRTQCEFGKYLHDHYPETIAECSLCKMSVFKGIQCDNNECLQTFHRNCLRKFLAKKSNCPNCKKLWNVPL